MRNFFFFDNKDSRDFGVYISGQGTFSAPARSYNVVQIPNRSGDLLGIGSRLENVSLTYPAFIYRDFETNLAALRAFLLAHEGYFKLQDTYHPDEYRKAYFPGPFEPEVTSRNNAGSFDLTFICKPQRFLVSGDDTKTFTANGSIINPTLFNAQPLIRIYGTGTVEIGTQEIDISSANEYTDIDCELMDCFKGVVNKNQYVYFNTNDFPVIPPGESGITLDGVTKVEITPRWWTV